MKHVLKFKLFENRERSNKILGKYAKNKSWKKIEDWAVDNKYTNYLGWLADSYKSRYWEIENANLDELFSNIKKYNIDVTGKTVDSVFYEIDRIKKLKPIKDFINKWCPSSLRKNFDITKFKIKNNRDSFKYDSDNLTDEQKSELKNGSYCKTFDEWANFAEDVINDISSKITKLKESNIIIIDESDDYIIYEPKDYESYMMINYNNWPLIRKSIWDNHNKLGFKEIIYLNKHNKSKSLLFEIRDNKVYSVNNFMNNDISKSNTICSNIVSIIDKYLNS